ncbi:MAG: hypothetical protein ACXQTX_06030, partial [Candidatus Syntropharchaeia archaeon]
SSGEPIEDQFSFLDAVEEVEREKVFDLLKKLHSHSIFIPAKEEEKPAPSLTIVPKPPPAEYDLERDYQFQYLLSRCEVLRVLVEKIDTEKEVTHEERLVLIHTVGYLDHGPEAVNELLKKCLHIEEDFFLKSRLRGNPMSCPKIRARIPHITSRCKCNCQFDPTLNMYPTPLLHIHAMEEKPGWEVLSAQSIQFQNLLTEYMKVAKDIKELSQLKERYEKMMNDFFDQAGIDSLSTPMGTLKRVREGEKVSFILEL